MNVYSLWRLRLSPPSLDAPVAKEDLEDSCWWSSVGIGRLMMPWSDLSEGVCSWQQQRGCAYQQGVRAGTAAARDALVSPSWKYSGGPN